MQRYLVLLFVCTLGIVAQAQDGIPAKTLADIKAATVFVKKETVRTIGSGSGFVIHADKDNVLVVTNQHVVTSGNVNNGPVIKLEVVFRSGKAKEEAVYPAEVVAADADRDLAVLRVKKVANPPKPIDLSSKVELTETLTVYAVGFPFGEALSTSNGNPAPTIGKGSVSSLRENDEGELAIIQIDGDINPGNSGGPVLDNKGRLVGVAVAGVRNTNIALAIPPIELTRMLQGRIGASGIRVLNVEKETAEVEIALQFIDPLEKVTAATVRLVKTDAPPKKPTKPGDHPELTGGTTHQLKISGQKGSIKLKLPVATHQMQVAYTNGTQKVIRTGTIIQDLPALARGGTRPSPSVSGTNSGPSTGTMSGAPSGPLPKPVNPLPESATTIGELRVQSVAIAGSSGQPQPGVRATGTVPCLTWTADGKGFYAIDHATDTVRRYSFPELKEEASLKVGKECSWLSLSKEGVVVTVAGGQEGWVLEPQTLKKGTAFPVNKARRVVSAPTLGLGYVCDTGDGPFGGGNLRVVDLKTGKKVKEYEAKDFDRLCALNSAVMSSDGKHLFTTGGLEQLMQFAVDGDKVKFVGASERMVSGAFQQPVVSTDGKLVCAPSGGGNSSIKAKKASGYSTFVFMPGNLAEPVTELKTGAYPAAVGFDTKAGLVYAQNMQDQFLILDRDGSKLKSQRLTKDPGFASVVQLLPHPNGWKVLALVSDGPFGGATVYSVELPKK